MALAYLSIIPIPIISKSRHCLAETPNRGKSRQTFKDVRLFLAILDDNTMHQNQQLSIKRGAGAFYVLK